MNAQHQEQGRVLVIAPHHDDEVIGCGGSIAKLAAQNHIIGVIYMTAGYAGLPWINNQEEAIQFREAEAIAAGKCLGVSEQIFLRHPDRQLSYSFERVAELVRIFRKWQVQGIYAPHPKERDREHRVVYEIVREALWISSSSYFPELGSPIPTIQRALLYEVWTPLQTYQHVEDISAYTNAKIEAIQCHASQLGKINPKSLLGLNYYRAALSMKFNCVEVFQR